MTIKFNFNLNRLLDIVSNNTRLIFFILITYIAINFFWWTMKPMQFNTLHNVLPDNFNNQTSQDIANRAPFGIAVNHVATEEKPTQDIKLFGVYAAGKDNSIAFITLNGTSMIAKIGDEIGDSLITNILSDRIVISTNKSQHEITISSGDAQMNSVPIQTNNSLNENTPQPSNTADHSDPSVGSIVEQRKKMIEQFQKQNSEDN